MPLSRFDLQNAPCGIVVFAEDLTILTVNRTLAAMAGSSAEPFVGQPVDRLLTPAHRLIFHAQVITLLQIHGRVDEIYLGLAAADGTEIPVLLSAARRTRESGVVTECVITPFHERKRLEDELFQVRKANEQIPGFVYQFMVRPDGSSCFPYASEGVRTIYEVSPWQVRNTAARVIQRIHPEDVGRIHTTIKASAKHLTLWRQEYRVNLPRAGMRWLESQAMPEARADGSVLWHGYTCDITSRKELEAALSLEHERTRVTLQSIGDAVITTDPFERVEYLNPVAERLTGWTQAEALGQPVLNVLNIVNQHTRLPAKNPISHCLAEGAVVSLETDTVLIDKTGAEYSIEDSAAPICTPDGAMLGVVMVFRDVTQQRILQKQIEHRASHDHLTGLANRAQFEAILTRMFDSAVTGGARHALCCLDLDRFKAVNDTCGHAVGDQLLQQVSDLIRKTVRAHDTVARLGGDEFALILEGCGPEVAQTIAQVICDGVNSLRIEHAGHTLTVGASIGIAPLDHRWPTPQAAYLAADQACYAAKNAGRGRVHLYSEDLCLTK